MALEAHAVPSLSYMSWDDNRGRAASQGWSGAQARVGATWKR